MRSVVTRLKVRCNLTEESPALSYWLYCQPLPCIIKNDKQTMNKQTIRIFLIVIISGLVIYGGYWIYEMLQFAEGVKQNTPRFVENLLKNEIRDGDIILITDLTRLSCGTKDLFNLVEQIRKKRANKKSLKESRLTQQHLKFILMAGN